MANYGSGSHYWDERYKKEFEEKKLFEWVRKIWFQLFFFLNIFLIFFLIGFDVKYKPYAGQVRKLLLKEFPPTENLNCMCLKLHSLFLSLFLSLLSPPLHFALRSATRWLRQLNLHYGYVQKRL